MSKKYLIHYKYCALLYTKSTYIIPLPKKQIKNLNGIIYHNSATSGQFKCLKRIISLFLIKTTEWALTGGSWTLRIHLNIISIRKKINANIIWSITLDCWVSGVICYETVHNEYCRNYEKLVEHIEIFKIHIIPVDSLMSCYE